MKIAIDAGHGRYTPGKRCLKSIDPKETREWTLNSRMAEKVTRKLKDYDCQTLRIDDPAGEIDISLSARCQKANDAKCDFYVSIHHNAGIQGGSGGGIVIYTYLGAKASTKAVARAVYDATVRRTGLKGNRSAPVAEANFQVLRDTKMSAILGEYGFMDSTADVPIILTEKFAEECAAGIVEGLASSLGLKRIGAAVPEKREESEEEDMVRYKTLQDVPEYGRAAVEKRMERGVLRGKDNMGTIDISEDMLREMVQREREWEYFQQNGKW